QDPFSLPCPRPASGPRTRRVGKTGALPQHHRRARPRRRSRQRRAQRWQGYGDGTATVSAVAAISAAERSHVRGRISRSGRTGLFVHIRLTEMPTLRDRTPTMLTRRALLACALPLGIAASRISRAALLSSPKPGDSVTIENFAPNGTSKGTQSVQRVVKTDSEWRRQLSLLAYTVTRHEGTEPAFSGSYDQNHADGLYACICCGTTLFDSRTKFDSGTGWPSFWRPISRLNVVER